MLNNLIIIITDFYKLETMFPKRIKKKLLTKKFIKQNKKDLSKLKMILLKILEMRKMRKTLEIQIIENLLAKN